MSILKLGLIGKSPPGKIKDIMNYLTRSKVKNTDLPEVTTADKIPIPSKKQTVEEMEAVNAFIRRNPRVERAGGGRIGFYKGELVKSGPNTGKYKVSFPGISAKEQSKLAANIPDEYFGTQVYSSKSEMNKAIKKRKELSDANIEARNIANKRTEAILNKEKDLRKIFTDSFKNEDFNALKPEFPGVAKGEGKIDKEDPSRKGKTGGKIPNQWYTKHVGPAVRGDVDALNDLSRITGISVEKLKDGFSKIKASKQIIRSKAAFESSAKLNPKGVELVELVNDGVYDKKTLLKKLKISDKKFQDLWLRVIQQAYTNRASINSGKNITSYAGSTLDEITELTRNLRQVDGITRKTQERNITTILNNVFGKDGTNPNPETFKLLKQRVKNFYDIRELLPENIKLNLDHPIPITVIEQMQNADILRANVQPITQALNMGLKSKFDIAYSNAYSLSLQGDKKATKIMRSIEEVAEKIGLPMGKITDTYIGLGNNPFLGGNLKQAIFKNLADQNEIIAKFKNLDPKLLQKAKLDRLKNINLEQINLKEVGQKFKKGDKEFGKFLSDFVANLDNPDQIRLARIGCPGKATGGRIGYFEGQNLTACATKGAEKLKNNPLELTGGDQQNLRALSKSAKTLRFLKNFLGPGAVVGELVFEGGIAANKFLNEGMPIKQALGESYINKYLLGEKLKIDLEEERKKELLEREMPDGTKIMLEDTPFNIAKGEEFAAAKRGERMFLPQGESAIDRRLKEREDEMKALYPQLKDANLSNERIDEILKEQNVFSPFTLGFGMQQMQPGIGDTKYNEDVAYQEIRDLINQAVDEDIQSQQFQNIADAGGVANLAGGGIAGLSGGIDKGPQTTSMNPDSQGLQGLLKRGIKG